MRQRSSRRAKQVERKDRSAAIAQAQASPPDVVWDELELTRLREHRALLSREFGSKNAGGAR